MVFTKISAAATSAFAVCAPFDPTLLCATGAFTMGTVTAAMGTVKTARKAMKKGMERSAQRPSQLSPESQKKFRKIISSISSASVSTAGAGMMSLVMPPALVGLCVSVPVLVYRCGQLYELKQEAGGTRALVRSISKTDIVANAAVGSTMSAACIIMFTGADEVKTVVEGLSELCEHPMECVLDGFQGAHTGPLTSELMDIDEAATSHGFLHATTAAADALPGGMKDLLGVEGVPVWHGDTSFTNALAIGVAAVAPTTIAETVGGRALTSGIPQPALQDQSRKGTVRNNGI